MEMNFDPMTGEPINKETPQAAEQNTEQTTAQETVQPDAGQPEMNFDPMTGKPVGAPEAAPKKKGGFNVLIAIAAAAVAVVVIALVVVGLVASGAFLGKGAQVIAATGNTFKEQGFFATTVRKSIIDPDGKYTISASGTVEDVEFSTTLASSKDRIQLAVSAETADMPKIAGVMEIDQEKIQMACPELLDYLFVYNFTEEKDGYLVDEVGEKEIEEMDETLQSLMNSKITDKKIVSTYSKKIKELYKTLEFKKEKDGEYKVDGKNRKCSAISVTVDADFMLDIIDIWEEYTEESMGRDIYKESGMNDFFKECRSTFRDMPDADVTFYLYKKQLAAVYVEISRSDMEIIFHGGDYRTQNIELLVDGDTILELTGKQDGSKETMELYAEGEGTIFELDYNRKTGEYSLELANGAGGVSGTIESEKDGVRYSVKELFYGRDSIDVDISVSILAGASFEKLSGEEFDIGNASERDFEDLYDDIKNLDEFEEWVGNSFDYYNYYRREMPLVFNL